MPQFKYTAVTQDNQKMTGSLSATDENGARKELNELGLAILNIEETNQPATKEITPTPTPQPKEIKVKTNAEKPEPKPKPEPTPEPETPSSLTKFEFEAIDKTGKKIIGTIPATDKLSALTRLTKEYHFDVNYLSKHNATQAEKDHDRQEGLETLKTQIKDVKNLKEESNQVTEQDKSFRTKQEILLKKVDYVLEKIKTVLQKFDKEIKPDNKKLIQTYIDKLLRIKNSTNLDYIEHTTEELLKKIQDQEIFLHKESLQKEKADLMIQSEQMLSSLKQSTIKKPSLGEDISEKLSKIKWEPLQNLIQKFAEKFQTDTELASLKSILKSTNKQLLSYINIWIKAKGKDAKKQVIESIKATFEERNKLKEQIKTYKQKKKHKKAIPEAPKKQDDTFIAETVNFLGWLLSFYIVYYFATYYFAQKNLPWKLSLPWNSNITETPLLKYLVAILMIWYILLASKIKFAEKTRFLTPALSVVGLILTALIVFNF